MFPGSRKTSKSTPIPLPPTPKSTLSITEATKTPSEIVTPTTTETTTQWFSLPYWRKRNVSQPTSLQPTSPQPTSPQPRSSENSPSRLGMPYSSRPLSLDKSLPPTPSDEGSDSKLFGQSRVLPHRSFHFPTYQQVPNTPGVQNAPQSAPVALPASRGLCISLGSASAHVEANISSPITPNTSYPPPVESNPSQQIRRSKSAHRLRAPSKTVASENLAYRRCRGVSFGATNLLLSPVDTTTRGKGKELDPSPNPPLPQSLSRKPSFWSKKKKSPIPATSTPQNESPITMLPLPLVDVSPFAPEFTIHPFQLSNPDTKPTVVPPCQRLHPDRAATQRTTPGSTTTSSTTSFEVVDPPLPNQEGTFMSGSPRGRATPPLLHRISFGVFSSPEPSPIIRPKYLNHPHSQSTTVLPFPSPKPNTQIPRPSIDGESPEGYILRLKAHVSKAEVASVLASRYLRFYNATLCI
jgi:hypothetical protein